ncbi:hypothetical protein [Acinetobacter rathckeae]|uniref:hypothetical protein n=1 Tax=Acinetobacter rathckeae TaxID=2605272 RepID=UPI0018A2B39C|nr:hypothetical protein [Acinetobacter rathckeae]MBF7687580.1 hypothetical protein [Acinetobacter rathckeae]MBF7694982.1 hypothetical protein [Acinetobacter rathckeae]
MSQQQRHLLQSMGVDVWVAKDTQAQVFVATQFWRDQVSESFDLDEEPPQQVVQNLVIDKPSRHIGSKHNIEAVTAESITPAVVKNQTIAPAETPLAQLEAEKVIQQVLPFTLALLVTDQCSVLFDHTQLLAEEVLFVENLVSALGATITQLRWPIDLAGFQQSDYINSYVKGFIDSVSPQQQVILLGNLPTAVNIDITYKMQSIAELMKNPTQKRALWESIKSIE